MWAVNAAIALSLTAGVLHLAIAPEHAGHSAGHALFFIFVGIVQILWSVAFHRRPTAGLYAWGILIAGTSIVLWAITRIWRAPFAGEPETADSIGITIKAVEGLTIAALIMVALLSGHRVTRVPGGRRIPLMGPTRGRTVAMAAALVLASSVLGVTVYGAGLAAEPVFPGLKEAEGHDAAEHTAGPDPGTATTNPHAGHNMGP